MEKIFDLSHYEQLIHGESSLVGGFSLSYTDPNDSDDGGGQTNNCNGGNCTSSCGTGQNVQCNAVAHCGT